WHLLSYAACQNLILLWIVAIIRIGKPSYKLYNKGTLVFCKSDHHSQTHRLHSRQRTHAHSFTPVPIQTMDKWDGSRLARKAVRRLPPNRRGQDNRSDSCCSSGSSTSSRSSSSSSSRSNTGT